MEYRKLRGKNKRYRVKVKNCRILYRIDDGGVVITVFKIGHRREVYRSL
ncbi:type II toxin-antitoxin system RelE family toxin [Rothia nasimurium]